MAARKMSCYRSPLTLNERRSTTALLSGEDGRTIHIRGRRRPNMLPNSYDDLPVSEAGWAKSKGKLPGAWFPNPKNAETPEKAARMEARRLSRKFKALVNAALAEAVSEELELSLSNW